MPNVVFIAGKSKAKYFSCAAEIMAAPFFNKKAIRQYSLQGLKEAFISLSREEIEELSAYYLQLGKRLNAGAMYRFWLRLRVRLYVARYFTFFRHCKEEYFALWNGYYLADRAMVLAGERCGKKPVYFENGLMPRTTTVDVKGVNFANSLPRSAEFYRNIRVPDDYHCTTHLVKRPLNSARKAESPIRLPKRYIFVPFQVESDTQVVLYGDWINSMSRLFDVIESVSYRMDDQELAFVFKEHPSSSVDYGYLKNRASKRLIFANGNNTEELIEQSEAVITINSTVGIEALMLQKKVLTLGLAFYSIDGLVLHAGTEQQLVAMVDSLTSWEPDAVLRKHFLWYLHERYLVKGSWREPDELHFLALQEKLEKLTRSSALSKSV